MNEKAINDLKWNYNHNLKRFYSGCKYCEEHKNEIDKWMPEIDSILENINIFLEEIQKYIEVSEDEIINGFKF